MTKSPLPFFSICIPAYKNAHFVGRLLQSVANQSVLDYEIIVSDDSPDDSVEKLVSTYEELPGIRYFRNEPAAGTPANWNLAINKATGKWIKIMHDDDWFSNNDALLIFKTYAEKNLDYDFFYCAYNNVDENGKCQLIKNSWFDILLIRLNILNIFRKNVIGNPSCTLISNEKLLPYDEKLKWLVDIDYYIMSATKNKKLKYLSKGLINVGLNTHQVTHSAFRNPVVEIPENLWVLEKHGVKILKNIIVYDHYWRLIRNLKIKNLDQVTSYYPNKLRPAIEDIITVQSHYGNKILAIGIFSKFLMFVHYVKFRIRYN
jgi:glycosyltransferase involved in cell wall biosynthesis